jgi:aspartyl aminopeptidase
MKNTVSAKVVDLLNSSYSAFHAVENIKNQLTKRICSTLGRGKMDTFQRRKIFCYKK